MSAVNIGVVTLFPEMLQSLCLGGVTARALEHGVLQMTTWNPRKFATNRHRRVDDRPYGGGPGMVLMAAPLQAATRAARVALPRAPVVHLTPQGERLTQRLVHELSDNDELIFLCGRYEGIDERVVDLEVDRELSIGDYVLSGGELAAMVVVDAVARLLPGTLGCDASAGADSFEAGLLDHPHYTRPEVYGEREVPDVLLGGNHEAIRAWRLKEAIRRTWKRRPDLLEGATLNAEQAALLEAVRRED